MFGISGFKLIIILIGALVLLGPDKLPEIGRTIGKAIQMFNAAKDDMEKVIRAEMEGGATESGTPEPPAATVASTLYSADEDDEEEEEE